MNYKNNIFHDLKELSVENPTYSFADLIYSVFQPEATKTSNNSLSWIRKFSDEDIYTMVEKSRNKEKEE